MTIDPYSDEYFIKEALKEAQKAYEKDEVPIGAVIVYQNQVIARAHNFTETLNDTTAHAEMQAFTSAADYLGGKYLNECTLFVTIEPCVMCIGAAAWTQVGKIVYGASDPKKGFSHLTSTKAIHPKTILKSGVLEEKCSAILSKFFKEKR